MTTHPIRDFILAVIGVTIIVLAVLLIPNQKAKSATSSEGAAPGSVVPSTPPVPRVEELAAPVPTQLDDGGGISSSPVRGWATFCRPTATRCQSWGGGRLLGAVPSFRWGDQPYTVTVRYGRRRVSVLVVSYCGCGNRAGKPTVIDLSPAAFARLAPLRVGVIPVSVTIGGRLPALPQTDALP